ncbi:MAG: flagellin [Mobilitalea sp.]
MIIQHNMAAMYALNRYNENTKNVSRKSEKLGTGYKINKAADNAAGLQISEKMRAQIKGLDQAQNNIQDGISLIQTADGGLSNVHDLLQRTRELCVQAASDTLNTEDKAVIKGEIDQMALEIDRIANQTEFNTIKPLTYQDQEEKIDLLASSEVYNDIADRVTDNTDIVFILDKTGSMGGVVSYAKATIGTFVDEVSAAYTGVNFGLIAYGDVTADTDPLEKYSLTGDKDDIKSYLSSVTASGGGDWEESGLEAVMDATEGALSMGFTSGSAKHFVIITDAPFHDPASNATDTVDSVAAYLSSQGITVDVIGPSAGLGNTQLSKFVTATGGKYYNVSDVDLYGTGKIIPPKILNLQVGANTDQSIQMDLFDSRAAGLGVNNLYVDPTERAWESLTKVDLAIDSVSKKRGEFGATQNRLEHALSNAGNASENMSNAESRIRDTDMAREMVDYTKFNILTQSAQSIMAQANTASDGILSLLQ